MSHKYSILEIEKVRIKRKTHALTYLKYTKINTIFQLFDTLIDPLLVNSEFRRPPTRETSNEMIKNDNIFEITILTHAYWL